MKRKLISVGIALMLVLSFSLVTAGPAEAVTPPLDREAAILAAADRLVEMQNLDGGFAWKVESLATTGPGGSATNTLGITAMGILKGHELLDKTEYETALAKAYSFAYTTSDCKRFPDVTFLIGLAEKASDDASLLAAIDDEVTETTVTAQSILDLAKDRWDARLSDLGAGDPVVMADFVLSVRGTLAFWDLEAAVKAALALEAHFTGYEEQALAIAEVMYDNLQPESTYYFDIEDTADVFYALALSGAIEGFSELGAYPTITRTMTGLLITNQYVGDVGGYWDQGGGATSDEESVQASAYAVMALIAQGDVDALAAAKKGADWFVNIQTETGGWYPGYVGATLENLEVDSEAAWALTTAIDLRDMYIHLPDGWSLISPDRAWSGWDTVDAELTLTYAYDEGEGVMAFRAPEQGALPPLTALYVKTNGGGWIMADYPVDDLGMYTTDLKVGWNLIGIPETNAATGAVLSPLRYGAGSEIALATLASQGGYNPSGVNFYQNMTGEWIEIELPTLHPFDGYWVCMNVAKEFGVVVVE